MNIVDFSNQTKVYCDYMAGWIFFPSKMIRTDSLFFNVDLMNWNGYEKILTNIVENIPMNNKMAFDKS